MIATGIVRRIDDLGRVVIPKAIRKSLGWNHGQPLEIFVEKENVVFKAYQPGCVFCNNLTDLVNFKGRLICKTCIKQVK